MTITPPTRKDMAEFFRLSLLAGLCEPPTVADWAESVVAADSSPHIAFIELCIAGSRSANEVQTLLHDVPGLPTPNLAVQMLLGHASMLISAQAFTPEQLLLRIYRIANLEAFSHTIYSQLVGLEDELSLARDGVCGTVAEVARDVVAFLDEYVSYAPENSP